MNQSVKVRDEIAAANEAFMAAFRAGDAPGVAALYTAGGQLLPPNMETMVGQAAVQAFWQGAMDMGIRSAQLEIAEVEAMETRPWKSASTRSAARADRCSIGASTSSSGSARAGGGSCTATSLTAACLRRGSKTALARNGAASGIAESL